MKVNQLLCVALMGLLAVAVLAGDVSAKQQDRKRDRKKDCSMSTCVLADQVNCDFAVENKGKGKGNGNGKGNGDCDRKRDRKRDGSCDDQCRQGDCGDCPRKGDCDRDCPRKRDRKRDGSCDNACSYDNQNITDEGGKQRKRNNDDKGNGDRTKKRGC